MVSAILWKEFREQGLVGLTLIVLGSGMLVAAAQLADPPVQGASPSDVIRFFGIGRLATLALAVTAGMVCGGAIFAAERETGTMTFLVSLPSTYRKLWRAKLLAGLLLTVIQIALLLAISAALGLVNTISWAMTVWMYSLMAFVWGMFGSTLARTSLGSVGLAVPAATVTALVAVILVMPFFQYQGSSLPVPRWRGAILFLACMFSTPLALSYRLFTQPDRNRLSDERKSSQTGIAAIFWLAFRQMLHPGLVMSLFALVLGLGLLTPLVQPMLVWPTLALVAGVLAGTTAFADEQLHGSARFWSEQRLPLGRAWVVKVGMHMVFGLWLMCLAAAPLAIHAQFSQMNFPSPHYGSSTLAGIFRSPLFDQLERQGWKFVVIPAVYGFAAGHLCGLTFRKIVVACGVAGVIGGVGAALWVPSLLSGGVKQWQLWLPPAICILTGRMLMRPWSADRLMERTPIVTLTAGSLATILAMFVGIGYRVLELPDSPTGEDDIRLVAKLPPYDENIAGRDFKAAAERYAHTVATLAPTIDRANSQPTSSQTLATTRRTITEEAFVHLRNSKVPEEVLKKLSHLKDREFSRSELQEQLKNNLVSVEVEQYQDVIQNHVFGGRTASALERLEQVPFRGWPTRDANLSEWLDRVFAPRANEKDDPPWHVLVATAAELPNPGIFEHPLLIDYMGVSRNTLEFARQMSIALLARGLQLQSRGDSEAFVSYFRSTMKLAQSMRNGTAIACFETAITIERGALFALDNWLENLPPAACWLRMAAGPLPLSFRQVPAAFYEAATSDEQIRLIRPILSFLMSCDPTEPFDATKQFLVERHIIREAMKAPVRWLPQQLSLPPEGLGNSDPIVELVAVAWTVPWEKERTRRIVGLGFESGKPSKSPLVTGRPGQALLLRNRTPEDLFKLDQEIRTQTRAGILKLAITIFWYEKKKYPDKLGELLKGKDEAGVDHGYLLRLPPDPYDETRAFGYRISAGEQLHSTPKPQSERMLFPREELNDYTVPVGQAIVWSVGPDRIDQGGISPPSLISNLGNRPEDAVFLVPLGPSRR